MCKNYLNFVYEGFKKVNLKKVTKQEELLGFVQIIKQNKPLIYILKYYCKLKK